MGRKWIFEKKDLEKHYGKERGSQYYKEGRWFYVKDDVGTGFKEVKTFRKALKKGEW